MCQVCYNRQEPHSFTPHHKAIRAQGNLIAGTNADSRTIIQEGAQTVAVGLYKCQPGLMCHSSLMQQQIKLLTRAESTTSGKRADT